MDTLNHFLTKFFSYFEQKKATLAQIFEERENRYIIKIPYVGKISNDFKNKLKQLFLKELKVKIMRVFNNFKKFLIISLSNPSLQVFCHQMWLLKSHVCVI